MKLEEIREYCLQKKGVTEDFPFDEKTLVLKVAGKMFCLFNIEGEHPSVNLKCDPEEALFLRDKYEEVKPGYHMNKKHWNTVSLSGVLSSEEILRQLENSYNLVFGKLPKKVREDLTNS